MMAVFGKFWASRIKENTMRGRWEKARSGAVVGCGVTLYGYAKVGEKRETALVIQEDEAEVVRLIFRWYVEDRLSLGAVAKRLTEMRIATAGDSRGHPSERGFASWSAQGVRRILVEESYTGQHASRRFYKDPERNRMRERDRSEWIITTIPAIISRELYKTAQARLARGRSESKGNLKSEHLMYKRLRCACGYSVQVKQRDYKRNGTVYQYRCLTRDCGHTKSMARNTSCGLPSFPTGEVDEVVWQFILKLLQEPEALLQGFDEYLAEQRSANAHLYATLEAAEASIAREEQALSNAVELYLSAPSQAVKDIALSKQREIEERLHSLRREQDVLRRQLASSDISPQIVADLREFGEAIAEELETNTSFEFRRGIIEDLGITGVLAEENGEKVIYINWLSRQDRRVVPTSPKIGALLGRSA